MTSENEKQKLKQPIPLTLSQYECTKCKKKFYINIEDNLGKELSCPFCGDKNVPNIREFDIRVEILAIGNK